VHTRRAHKCVCVCVCCIDVRHMPTGYGIIDKCRYRMYRMCSGLVLERAWGNVV